VTTAYRRFRHLASALVNREHPVPMPVYESFDAALRDSNSYEDPRLIEVVAEKTRNYKEALAHCDSRIVESRQSVQNMFVLSFVKQQRPLNVVEIGGACGASYFEAKHLRPVSIDQWSIVETPLMASAGNLVNDDPALSFHTDIDAALQALTSVDIVIVQGTLQYLPDPGQLLKNLFSSGIPYIYVTRTPVTNQNTPIITKQETDLSAHGPGTLPNMADAKSTQPMTLLSQGLLFSFVPLAYEIVFTFNESEARMLPIGNSNLAVRDIGFLVRKQVY